MLIASVPVAASAAACPSWLEQSPMVQGSVNGHWIGILVMNDGTNGGAQEAQVYSNINGGNGAKTQLVGTIKARGEGGDRLSVFFNGPYVYAYNEIYGPNEAHCCGTHLAVARYKIGGDATSLSLAGTATVATKDIRDFAHPNKTACGLDAVKDYQAQVRSLAFPHG